MVTYFLHFYFVALTVDSKIFGGLIILLLFGTLRKRSMCYGWCVYWYKILTIQVIIHIQQYARAANYTPATYFFLGISEGISQSQFLCLKKFL
jgi:hypothetical protein